MNNVEVEQAQGNRSDVLEQKFQGTSTVDLINMARGGDMDAFNEITRRYTPMLEGIRISVNSDPNDEFAATRAVVMAVEWMLADPSMLENALRNGELNAHDEIQLRTAVSEVLQELAPRVYQQIQEYRSLTTEDLQQRAQNGDTAAMHVLYERTHSTHGANLPELDTSVERIILSGTPDNLVLGGRLFTENYVDVVKQGGKVIKQIPGWQLKPEVVGSMRAINVDMKPYKPVVPDKIN